MMKIIFFSIISLAIISCSKPKSNPDSSDIKIIEIVHSEKKESMDSIFKGFRVVPLETNSESLIKKIHSIKIYQNIILINDNYNKILAFNIDGTFLNQIGLRGSGPMELINPRDMILNSKNEIEILDERSIKKYTIDGKFVNKINVDKPSKGHANFYKFIKSSINNNYYLWSGSLGLNNMSYDNFFMSNINENGIIIDRFFPATHSEGPFKSCRFTSIKDTILICPTMGDYNIYQIDESNNLSSRYFLDLGDKAYKGEIKFGLDPYQWDEIRKSAYQIFNFFETENWLTLCYTVNKSIYSFFYNKITNKQYHIDILNGTFFTMPAYCYKKCLISHIDSYLFKSVLESMPVEELEKRNLTQYLKIDESENPVLIFYEFK